MSCRDAIGLARATVERSRFASGIAAVIICLSVAGCCGYRPDLPPTARVTGTVTLDGRPLPDATVQFVPDASQGTSGAAAVGFTDAEGKYELVTATVKGAIVGHHKVSVEARAKPKDEYDTLPALLTPERYRDPQTSSLQFEVKSGQANVIDLPLTSQSQ